jgi:hypothetical protein
VLSLSSPLSWLRNVWFHVVLFFCRGGLEGQRSLTTNSFKFETDVAGENYTTMSHDELSKNHPGVSQSVLRFSSIRRKITWLKMPFGTKHDRLE